MARSDDEIQHWRSIAHKAHAAAEQLADFSAKEAMLQIAAGYERLAEQAEKNAALIDFLDQQTSKPPLRRT